MAFNARHDCRNIRCDIEVQVFQLLHLVFDLLDGVIDLFTDLHDLQDVFNQSNGIDHNVEQEGISAASRQQQHQRHATLAYPGTCRAGLDGKAARAWRVRVPEDEAAARIVFQDRWHGTVEQNLATEVGDFVLKRADGQWAYQLAVVVDDAAQQITHIVRGADLLESTARQIYLQGLLGVPTPAYLHVPVVENEAGEKLSKQTGAQALDLSRPLQMLQSAAHHLGLPVPASAASIERFHASATQAWAARYRD